jgi:predicted amidophosphoribosyltransferase
MLRVKFGRRRELLRPLAGQLASSLRVAGLERGCTLITPVPSGPLADLRRGFSPSRELARLLSRELGLEFSGWLISRKIIGGGALKRLGASGRRRRAKAIFATAGRLSGQTVLLVDDIMATGASVEACARLLKDAGAGEVRAAIWARALIDFRDKDYPITLLDDLRG